MKIACIISDASAMVHVGADLERIAYIFDVPEDIEKKIRSALDEPRYGSVSFAIVNERTS